MASRRTVPHPHSNPHKTDIQNPLSFQSVIRELVEKKREFETKLARARAITITRRMNRPSAATAISAESGNKWRREVYVEEEMVVGKGDVYLHKETALPIPTSEELHTTQ